MLSEIRPLHDIARQVLIDSMPDGKQLSNMDRRTSKALELLASAVNLLHSACINIEHQDESETPTERDYYANWYW